MINYLFIRKFSSLRGTLNFFFFFEIHVNQGFKNGCENENYHKLLVFELSQFENCVFTHLRKKYIYTFF